MIDLDTCHDQEALFPDRTHALLTGPSRDADSYLQDEVYQKERESLGPIVLQIGILKGLLMHELAYDRLSDKCMCGNVGDIAV